MDHHRLSVAPMMEYTDRVFRRFLRIFTKQTLLYTELIVDKTIHYCQTENREMKALHYSKQELPLVAQLGGSEPEFLKKAALECENRGYSEINLNVGCPSEKVQAGQIGVCLMKDPDKVANCLYELKNTVNIPVSIKHRLGVDEYNSYSHLCHFVDTVASKGITNFIVHARYAKLNLSPAKNRAQLPVFYETVYQLKQDFPELKIEINGNVKDLTQAKQHLEHVDGVMIGRAAYSNPWILSEADSIIFGMPQTTITRKEVVMEIARIYNEEFSPLCISPHGVIRHIMGLFKGCTGARQWRAWVNQQVSKEGNPSEFLPESLSFFQEEELFQP